MSKAAPTWWPSAAGSRRLLAQYGEDRGRVLWEFDTSGVELIRQTIKGLAIDCDYQVQDSLFVARTPGAFPKVIEAEHQAHASMGYGSTVYDRTSLQAIVGSHAYYGGVQASSVISSHR